MDRSWTIVGGAPYETQKGGYRYGYTKWFFCIDVFSAVVSMQIRPDFEIQNPNICADHLLLVQCK